MHHRGGALAETEQIYGAVMREGLLLGAQNFCSVGLGLGYNELMIAREALHASRPQEKVSIISYESDLFLVESFLSFLENPDNEGEINNTYRDLLQQMLLKTNPKIQIHQVCEFLLGLKEKRRWLIQGALSKNLILNQCFDSESFSEVVLYDAFSSKTSPELWSEDFLQLFLQKTIAPRCLFSTYACTGTLKRTLKSQSFDVILREGFHGKRNSTLGRRWGF